MPEIAPNPYQKETFALTNPLESAKNIEKTKNSFRLFREAMDRLRDSQLKEIQHGYSVSKSKVGAEAGKCLVRYLSSRQDSPNILKPVRKFVEKFLSSQRTGEFMGGFVGEYAFAHLLASNRDYVIEYPETEEDIDKKADWVIVEPNKPDAYLQTKVLPLQDEQVEDAQLIYDITNPSALKKMEENLYSYYYKGNISIGDYTKRAEEMFRVNQGSNKRLIFCLIPSSEVSVTSGTFVNRDFLGKMRNELSRVGL